MFGRPTLSVRPSAGRHYPPGVIKVTPRPEQEHVRHFSVQCAVGLQQAHFCELKYSSGDECLFAFFSNLEPVRRQRARPEFVAAPRYFLVRAYVWTIAGQGPSPQASVAESSLCSRLQRGARKCRRLV
jgi:hypothetical protein